MKQIIQSNKYDELIDRIKRKRRVVIVLTIIAVLITISICSPMEIVVLDETIVLHKGINPIFTVLIVLAILSCELVAYALVSSPLNTSMDNECDPEKHLILNSILNKQKNKNHIYAVDFFYIGDFRSALYYSNNMIKSKKSTIMLIGLFNKARCEFMLEDFDSLKATVVQYEITLNSIQNINQKTKDIYEKLQKSMKLLIAISDKDNEKISNFYDIEIWNNSKSTQGFVNYLKGIAAYNLNDKRESIYRLMYVKDNCSKTVFAELSEQYLNNIM